MSVEKIVRNYLRDFQKDVTDLVGSGARALELSTRPVVTAFLERIVGVLKPGAIVQHEAHVGRENRPDWRIEDPTTFGIYAYADHKGLVLTGPPVLSAREVEQVQRYLELGRPVFVFDGIDFLFYTDNATNPELISLVDKPLRIGSSDWSALPINPLFEIRLRTLLEEPGFKKWTEGELIQQLARRARILSESIAALLSAPLGSGATSAEQDLMTALHQLYDLARQNHDPTLTDRNSCADFIAQVLVFGLFYAHVTAPEAAGSPETRRDHIDGFWMGGGANQLARKLRPFQAIVDILGDTLNVGNDLSDWYREVVAVLAHAEYMGTKLAPVDFHALFEKFFDSFDRQLKFDRGVFFTPGVLTGWMTRITDQLLVANFGGGMASVVDKLIDPCCGTGGFLEAAVELTGDVKNGPHFIGFEILPAPYALAHYRLSRIGEEWTHRPHVSIVLTDTLSDRLLDPPPKGKDGFSTELAEAAELARPPIRVVIGNPPSTIHNFSAASRTTIDNMMQDFRPPSEERRSRQNIQQGLSNEAFRFLRWSANEVLASSTGVMSLVMPDSLVRHASLNHARKWLLDHFDDLYILRLDSDQRTGQAVGQPIFDVQQGRAVLFAVRRTQVGSNSREDGCRANIFIQDVSGGTRDEKVVFLSASDPKITGFSKVEVVGPQWRFAPSDTDPSKSWGSCWPLRAAGGDVGVFKSKCSAVKLAPTCLVFHTDRLVLERRSSAVSARVGKTNWSNSVEKLIADWWRGQRKPPKETKFTDRVRKAVGGASVGGRAVAPYTFRPFVDGFVLDDDELFAALNETQGGGTRARPEIRAAFSQGAFGIAVAPSPVDLGSSLTRFASFCWQLPDNDISARGNAMIFCDKFPEEKRTGNWNSAAKPNFTTDFFAYFDDAHEALFYAYAVLSCDAYLDAFESQLFQPADPSDPPRIPLVADTSARQRIAELGRQAASCERSDAPLETMDLDYSWPDGLEEIQVVRYSVESIAGTITLSDGAGRSVRIAKIPSEVISLRVSGHDVVEKWLRERTFSYLRRSFRQGDLELLVDLIARIARQQAILAEVSAELENHLEDGLLAPPKG